VPELAAREVADDDNGSWTSHVRPLHPALARYVASYHGYTQRVPSPGGFWATATHVLPLVVSLEGHHSISPPGARPTVVDSFLAGIHRRVVRVEATAFCGIQVNLTPLGAFGLLGGGVGELAGRAESLDATLDGRGRRLVERVGNASSWEERLEQAEQVLLAWFDDAPRPSPEVEMAWESIVAGRGRSPVEDLARECGWSRHHLGRRMREELGASPKLLSRMVRFRLALDMVRRSGRPLAEIAAAAGYSDQAHMNCDFREFTGRSPGSFAPG